MIDNNLRQQVKDIALTLIFSLLYIFLVVRISILLLALLPIPYIVLGNRHSMRTSILAQAILFTILNLMFNINLAITILILALPVSLLVQFMSKRKYSTDKIILGTTLLLMVIMFASLYVEGQVTGVDLVSQMDKNFESMLEVQKNALRDLEMSKSEIDKAGTIMRGTYNYIVTVMPMIIFIFSLIIAYLNYKISAFLINRTRDQSLKVPEFSLFTLPDNFIVGTVIMLLTSTIINRMEIPYALALRQNLMFIIGFLFLIQGFSLFDYFLKKIKIKKFFRVLILLINLILMPIGGILMILGFADSIFDLRKIRKKA